MPVKRRLSKQREGAVSDTAIALFKEMKALCSGSLDLANSLFSEARKHNVDCHCFFPLVAFRSRG